MERQEFYQIVSIPGNEVRDEGNSDLSLLTGKELDENCFKLDHLGPMVLNQDGTISRIGNWEEISDVERANAIRLVCKRNKQRAQIIRDKKAAEKELNDGVSESS
jgi:hypothetical protein